MQDAYFAGFFDGEGCIRIDRIRITSRPTHYTRYQLKVSVGQCDPVPLKLLQARFGGAISTAEHKNPKHRTTFHWYAWSGFAFDVLTALRPFLIVKAEEADVALEFYRKMKELGTHFRQYRGNPPDKDEILAAREILVEKLNQLKRRTHQLQRP